MQLHETNPDHLTDGCLVTKLAERGVIFPEIDVFGFTHCFIGESALIEATALVLGTTPDKLREFVDDTSRIADLEAQLADASRFTTAYHAMLDGIVRAMAADPTQPESHVPEDTPAPKTRKSKAADTPADLE